MRVERLTVGPLDVNCYILWDEKSNEAIVIDPGAEPDRILDAVKQLGVTVKMIVNTHGHIDHIGANKEVKAALGCPPVRRTSGRPIGLASAVRAR